MVNFYTKESFQGPNGAVPRVPRVARRAHSLYRCGGSREPDRLFLRPIRQPIRLQPQIEGGVLTFIFLLILEKRRSTSPTTRIRTSLQR